MGEDEGKKLEKASKEDALNRRNAMKRIAGLSGGALLGIGLVLIGSGKDSSAAYASWEGGGGGYASWTYSSHS